MNSIKSHFSLIFALLALLVSYQLYLTVVGLAKNYEDTLNRDYAVIAVSSVPIDMGELKKDFSIIKSVERIDAMPYLSYMQKDLSAENYSMLKESLPGFFKIKLYKYPSKEELSIIEKILKNKKGVLRVETFTKSQNALSNLLDTFKAGAIGYLVVVFSLNILLFTKFMEVWRYEHINRMQVMALYGAPVWMRSVILVKMAIFDSILAIILALGVFYGLSISPDVAHYIGSLGLGESLPFDWARSLKDFSAICMAVSFVSVSFVAFRRLDI
jgi:cell division transport system permease protein